MMNNQDPMTSEFNFDTWAALSGSNPAEFDRQREEWLEKAIEMDVGNQESLRKMQWRIDMERRKAKTPLQACLRISGMMWDTFLELNDQLVKYFPGSPHAPGHAGPSAPPGAGARILPFGQTAIRDP